MRYVAVAALMVPMMISACTSAGQITPDDMSCGTPDGRNHKWSFRVEQYPLKPGPSYYYRADVYVILIQQDIIKEKVWNWTAGGSDEVLDPIMRRFAKDILTQPKLQSYQDLYAYSLPDGDLWAEIRFMVVDLILEGKATVVDPGGSPVDVVLAVRSKSPGSSATGIYVWNTEGSPILNRLECIAD